MRNTTTTILSVLVSGLILIVSRSNSDPTLEGLTGRLWLFPVYFVLVPLIFGLIIYISSKENRFKRALVSFGISAVVAIIVLLLFAVTQGD